MKSEEWKKILPFTGMPIMMLLLFALRVKEIDPAVLLLREVLLVFGYLAAVGDWREMRVPNRLVIGMLIGWIIIVFPQLFYRTEYAILLVMNGLVGFLLSGIVFLLVYLVSRKGLGGGDVKFMAVSGAYLGASGSLASMLYGSIFAAIGGGLLILMKKIGLRDAMPLVPFLYAGILLVMFIQ